MAKALCYAYFRNEVEMEAMKNITLLLFLCLLCTPGMAQLSYELELFRPDRQINHAIWKNQNDVSSITTSIKRSELGRIKDFSFFENDRKKYQFQRRFGNFVLRDSINDLELVYRTPNSSQSRSKQNATPDGKYILPDGSQLTRWREELWEPSMIIELTDEYDEVIGVAYYATDPPQTVRKLIVKIVKPTEHNDLILAMLTFDILRSYREYYRSMLSSRLDPDW